MKESNNIIIYSLSSQLYSSSEFMSRQMKRFIIKSRAFLRERRHPFLPSHNPCHIIGRPTFPHQKMPDRERLSFSLRPLGYCWNITNKEPSEGSRRPSA